MVTTRRATKNSERYVTDEPKTFETKVLRAEEQAKGLEYDLFVALRERVAAATTRLQGTATRVAELDVYASFAHVARRRSFRRPLVDDNPGRFYAAAAESMRRILRLPRQPVPP